MYKKRKHQFTLSDFNQPLGLKMDPENHWIKLAELIPWEEIEDRYAELFPKESGTVAKPLRMALGALLIQKKYGYSDRTLVELLKENPYYQYFMGLPGYQAEAPFVPSLLVEFRKRLTEELLIEINRMVVDASHTDDKDNGTPPPSDGQTEERIAEGKAPENVGTLILDATVAPQEVAFPQDINLLNQCREKLEQIIAEACRATGEKKPRMYRDKARQDYLSLAKCKKRTVKKIRAGIRKQLQYIRRDRRYLGKLLEGGYKLTKKQEALLETIDKIYEQQKQMYDTKTHTVKDRIVSLSQPWIRPIVRGKAKADVEFGAKLDMSVDERGYAQIERLSFDAFNESEDLQGAVERYRERTGHYPERVLVDKIYRNRKNLSYCAERGIRISGPALGRPKKGAPHLKQIQRQDNADRIEVERAFSLAKRSYGLGKVKTKLEKTTRSSIVLSILLMNLEWGLKLFLHVFVYPIFSRCKPLMAKLFSVPRGIIGESIGGF